jgi:hypothetical protein
MDTQLSCNHHKRKLTMALPRIYIVGLVLLLWAPLAVSQEDARWIDLELREGVKENPEVEKAIIDEVKKSAGIAGSKFTLNSKDERGRSVRLIFPANANDAQYTAAIAGFQERAGPSTFTDGLKGRLISINLPTGVACDKMADVVTPGKAKLPWPKSPRTEAENTRRRLRQDANPPTDGAIPRATEDDRGPIPESLAPDPGDRD